MPAGSGRETVIVNGRMALRAERMRAAREGANGRQVLAVEHAAERLAGGFLKTVNMRTLRDVLRRVLPDADVGELSELKDCPGFVAAAAATLVKFWMSDPDLESLGGHPRIKALLSLDAAVAAALPSHMRRPHEIIALAADRARHAPKVLGKVTFRGMTDLHPVWRRLIAAMVDGGAEIVWDAGPREVPGWAGSAGMEIVRGPAAPRSAGDTRVASCASPYHETIEAFRWARALLASGTPAGEIAIATCVPAAYEGYAIAADRQSGLGFHFSRGLPASCTREGQAAGALADLLCHGKATQKRVRRLVEACGTRSDAFRGLPEDWRDALPRDAMLALPDYWGSALARAPEVGDVLLPAVRRLHEAAEAMSAGALSREDAAVLGREFLPAAAVAVWEQALDAAPPAAVDMSVAQVRVPDATPSHGSPCFMSAEEYAASPRRHVWLLGLTSRGWPRRDLEDSLVPAHVMDESLLRPLPPSEADERDFATAWYCAETFAASWPRRDAQGRRQSPSHLVSRHARASGLDALAAEAGHQFMGRFHPPSCALSPADLASCDPRAYAGSEVGRQGHARWKGWVDYAVGPHDGSVDPDDPAVAAALARPQSPTSLALLLRNPLGFVWKYALGFSQPDSDEEGVWISPRQFGNLAHATLRQAVEALERRGGLAQATQAQVALECRRAAGDAARSMEVTQPVPPRQVWLHAIEETVRQASAALLAVTPLEAQKSHAEASFGEARDWDEGKGPWDPREPVLLPGTQVRLQGVIDRLDLSGDGMAARVVDYKTGRPKNHGEGLDGGREVQRVSYGLAVRALTEAGVDVESGLLWTRDGVWDPLGDIDAAAEILVKAVQAATAGLAAGRALPGPDPADHAGLAFALPAASAAYLRRKKGAIVEAAGEAAAVWSEE